MSRNPVASYTMRGFRMGAVDFKDFLWEALLDPAANATMGDTAENLARQYQITRPEVDAFAARSFERALAASGFLAGEIAAVKSESFEREGFAPRALKLQGAKELPPPPMCVLTGRDARDHPPGFRRSADRRQFLRHRRRRGGGTGRLRRLRAQVRQAAARAHRGGRDRRRAAAHHGHRSGAGDQGGARARGSALKDIDRFEINEAFGAQVMACARELGIDEAKLNVNGGAIAIGHPLGATGVRLAVTLARQARALRYGIASACIGGGQGIALLIENPDAASARNN